MCKIFKLFVPKELCYVNKILIFKIFLIKNDKNINIFLHLEKYLFLQ